MGEIGISERKFLYHYKHWQLQAILRGYRKRTHDYLLLTRWQTWALLKGFCGLEAESPSDILALPCDPHKEREKEPTEDEINALIAECQEENRRKEEERKKNTTDKGLT